MKPIDKDILHLALPSIVSNITVPLLGLVDLAIGGHIGPARYIAAISVGSMIFNVIYWLMGFLRMGTSGMTGQAFGARDARGVRLLLRRSLSLSLIIATAFLIFQWPIREVALAMIHPSADVWSLATTYFNIVIWGAPAMLSLYSLNGWYIGMQDTRVPMFVAIFQNVVNILASMLFVFAFGMRIEGIALGTLVAQWSGALLSLALLRGRTRGVNKMFADGPGAPTSNYSWRVFFHTDRDIFLRTICLVSVNFAFTSMGARQGDMTLAVNTLLMTFFTLFSYVMDGFAFAGEALSGKCFGARDTQGLGEVLNRLLLRWGLSLSLVFTVAYVFGGGALVGLLTDDMAVRKAVVDYEMWVWLLPIAGFAAFVYDGIFIGITATSGMLLSSFASSIAFFLILGVTFMCKMPESHPVMVNHLLWLAFIVYLASRGLMQHLLIRRMGILNGKTRAGKHKCAEN